MSTLNKYDLTLLGNIIIDEIYCVPYWAEEGTSNIILEHDTSIGGIGNIIKELSKTNLHLFVETIIGNDEGAKLVRKFLYDNNITTSFHLSDKPTSRALIISSNNERTSFVKWGCSNDFIASSNVKSNWSHISYLDVCTKIDLESIRLNSNIISADLCLSKPSTEIIRNVLQQLSYLDYLFVSESEISSLIPDHNLQEFVKQHKLKCLVFHTKTKTILVKEESYQEVNSPHKIFNDVNVLGAGDVYCANFIYYLLKNVPDEMKAALWAHQQATTFISRKHEKI